jgi:hypothetical protein
MEIGVRDLRNRTGQVIDAVRAGERVTLTVHGQPPTSSPMDIDRAGYLVSLLVVDWPNGKLIST